MILKELSIELKNQFSIFNKHLDLDQSIFSKISANQTLLFHGGGNFGDLYRHHHNLRNLIIQHFPKHKIIIFPQTINYQNKSEAKYDNQLFSKTSKLSINLRSKDSYELAKSLFPTTKSFIVPDAAFMIGDVKPLKKPDFDIFVLRRSDGESRFSVKIWEETLKKKVANNYSFIVSLSFFYFFI